MTTKTTRDEEPPSGRIHECCVCKKQDMWTNEWRWFGSYKQLEDQGIEGVKPILKFCSDGCAKQRSKRIHELRDAMDEEGVYV